MKTNTRAALLFVSSIRSTQQGSPHMVSYVILLNAIFKSPSLALLEWGGGGNFQIKSKLSQLESEGKKNIYPPFQSYILYKNWIWIFWIFYPQCFFIRRVTSITSIPKKTSVQVTFLCVKISLRNNKNKFRCSVFKKCKHRYCSVVLH